MDADFTIIGEIVSITPHSPKDLYIEVKNASIYDPDKKNILELFTKNELEKELERRSNEQ